MIVLNGISTQLHLCIGQCPQCGEQATHGLTGIGWHDGLHFYPFVLDGTPRLIRMIRGTMVRCSYTSVRGGTVGHYLNQSVETTS